MNRQNIQIPHLGIIRFFVHLPFAYMIAVMFFIPDGDSYITWFMVPAILLAFYYRFKTSNWGVGPYRSLIYPIFVYTLVLSISYLTQGGFASAVRPFVFFSFFLYLSLPVLTSLEKLRYLFILSGFELAAVSFYQHTFLHVSRASGFTNPIFWGTFSCCNALLCLYLAELVKSNWIRYAFWLASLFSVYAMILSKTRGVFLAIVPILIIYCVYIFRTARHPKLFIAAVMGTMLLILIYQQDSIMPRVQTAVSQVKNYVMISPADDAKKAAPVYRTSVGVRLVEWKFSLSVFKESPIWGLGRKGAERAKERYVREGLSPSALLMFKKGHVHNQYLQELVVRGLMGVFALIALLFVPLQQGMRRAKENDWTGYAIISLSIAFATFCLTEATLKHPYKIYVYLFFMAFLFLVPRQTAAKR